MGSASIPRSPIWGKRETELRSNNAPLVQSPELGDLDRKVSIREACLRAEFPL